MTSPAHLHASATAPALADPVEAALALRAQGRLKEALELLSAHGTSGSDLDTLRGDLQLELDRPEEAARSYFTVIESEPGNVYAYANLALSLYRLERWEASADAAAKALELDPHRDPVRIARGDCLLRLNRFEEALACFDMCWSDAAREQALFGKAVALQFLRRFDDAEILYRRLLELSPRADERTDERAGEALSNLIAMCMEVFDLTRVHRYSSQLLELCPQSRVALQGLILVAVERREYSIAARYFARLAQYHPESIVPGEERGGGARIEYRLSSEVLARLNQIWRQALVRK